MTSSTSSGSGSRNSECGIKKTIFFTSMGWTGIAVSGRGITKIVLPKKDKRTVERELSRAERPRSGYSKARFMLNPEKQCDRTSGPDILSKSVCLLEKYFSGQPVVFDLPLDLRYYTAFQQSVWRAAAQIPFGSTRSYSWIANRIKNPKAMRAVGRAMGANPVPIIIPCHRVIGSAGTLCGFSAGLDMKKKLLELESGKIRKISRWEDAKTGS